MPLLNGGRDDAAPTLLLFLRLFFLFQVRQPVVHILNGTADGVVVVDESLFSCKQSFFGNFHHSLGGLIGCSEQPINRSGGVNEPNHVRRSLVRARHKK